MAADRMGDSGGVRCWLTKLHRLDDGRVIGLAGGVEAGLRFIEALRAGRQPDFSEDDRAEFHALVMHPDGRIEEWETERFGVPVEDPFWAIGSGRVAALAAMHMGADATRAVEIAALCDVGTGNGWVAMRCRD